MDSILSALLEQIGRTGRFRDACGAALSLALDEVGLRRGVVVVRKAGGMHGVGAGVEEPRVRTLLASAEAADAALADAFGGDGPRLLADPAHLPGLDFASCVVIPFRFAPADGAGLVIVEAARPDERTAFVAKVFGAAAPALGRCIQLERLERRAADLDRRHRRLAEVVESLRDPVVLTDKWTISYPMFLDTDYEFFEYACHEGNTAVRNFIETSRYERGLTPSGEPREE